ncbi:hypothetical protein TNCV_2445321 [Trichonephila clavipes]|nr:hypothetical protein TNCV_2445321 [Trichonephila clavipes]
MEGQKSLEPLDNNQDVFLQNGGVTCKVLKVTNNECSNHDEFRAPRSDCVIQVALTATRTSRIIYGAKMPKQFQFLCKKTSLSMEYREGANFLGEINTLP